MSDEGIAFFCGVFLGTVFTLGLCAFSVACLALALR